ncbi:glycoside hydrolase family 1 protein [Celerinatantimonas diazotrophica]|uniref:Aryl-phospho-beta-glucosidase n=1 Tax=Celerinatantimonas diazotrophica TaxID=412034 RepID=A0A4R1K4Z5_9GAMM|nr:glycoside hydrolase family 1 protein [Celerinatantimonas diazotrophica]TCK59020.1 aryl-phospho-beta-glucosidase [Celerinatantimonas diazotrophica]CAG9297655.1 6-phospho-beta-glucosidase GmuD [Celerinatantimonas diazotrophica]
MCFYKFPNDFWWGSASSAAQSEGASLADGKAPTIWDHWFEQQPGRFFDEVGPAQTSTFYENYKSDIQLMKQLGHNSFRTSISWARLIPDGVGAVNPKAVTFYSSMIRELKDAGIEPFICLFHFDMPLVMQEKGGWENREVVDAYVEYAKTCFELFGQDVRYWFTFNEPIVPVEQGYLYDAHYPNVVDFKRAVQVAYNTMIAHAKAVSAYHDSAQNGQIGIVLNLTPSYPRSSHPSDEKAARIADLLFNRSFLDPAVLGQYPHELAQLMADYSVAPQTQPEDKELLRSGKVDMLGVNYYQPRRVKARLNAVNPDGPMLPEWFFEPYEMPGRKMNRYRGWEIYAKGVYDILLNLKNNYGNIPCYISENGMGVEDEERFLVDGQVQDDYRIEFIRDHLIWINKAMSQGANCRGYHLWTFIDCWSWANAYKNRYGFVALDLKTQQRTIKKSGHWIAQIVQEHGFECGEK